MTATINAPRHNSLALNDDDQTLNSLELVRLLRAAGCRLLFRSVSEVLGTQYRAGILAVTSPPGKRAQFTVIVDQTLTAEEVTRIVDWAWARVKVFAWHGPNDWTYIEDSQWQLLYRVLT